MKITINGRPMLMTDIAGKEGMVRVSGNCIVTGGVYFVDVNKQRFLEWMQGGGLIQRVFPELNADQREFLISGTSPEGWKKLFG